MICYSSNGKLIWWILLGSWLGNSEKRILWTPSVKEMCEQSSLFVISHHVCVCVCVCVCMSVCVCAQLCFFETPCTVAHQAVLSMGFPRQEYWTGLPFPPPGDFPDPGIKPASPMSPALQVDSLQLSHQGSLWNKANVKHYSSNLIVFWL